MRGRICIYCLAKKDASAFNAEHVLPQAFGRFEQNLTLNCVCQECNKYFGDHLELYFTRDGIEGLQRLQYGVKPADGIQQLRRERIQSKVLGEGPHAGLHVDLVSEDGELRITPVLQVGFLVRGQWIYVTEKQLEDASTPLPAPVNNMKLMSNSEAGDERLVALLRSRGINFQRRGITPPLGSGGDWAALEIRTTIDAPILRCIAKIAFNYMAWVTGPDFARRDELNVVRSFIRHGVKPSYPLVAPTTHPVLADDLTHLRQTDGHLLAVLWSAQGPHLIGQVSLFNHINYRVGLIHDFRQPLPAIRSGHHFDWKTRTITKLQEKA